MNQYLEKLEKLAAYTDQAMYMRTALGTSGAGPDTPAIYAANQRARFAMPQADRDTIFRRNMLRSDERKLTTLVARSGKDSETLNKAVDAAIQARKTFDVPVRNAYGRYSIQNENGPILNLTQQPIKSHPATGPVGLRQVVYKGDWPINPLGVPNSDISYKSITEKGNVINQRKSDKINTALRQLDETLGRAGNKVNKAVEKAVKSNAGNVAQEAASAPMPLAAKAILGGLGVAGALGTAYAIHQHNRHNQEKRANAYLEKIAAWRADFLNKPFGNIEAWKQMRLLNHYKYPTYVSRAARAYSNDVTDYLEQAIAKNGPSRYRERALNIARPLEPYVPDLRT